MALYEEEPKNALDFVKARLGAPTASESTESAEELRRLRDELAAARAEADSLRAKMAALGVDLEEPAA